MASRITPPARYFNYAHNELLFGYQVKLSGPWATDVTPELRGAMVIRQAAKRAANPFSRKGALVNDTVNVFISHKLEDRATAIGIRDILKDLDDDENPVLNFFLSEEIKGGEKWYEKIREQLTKSNILLLLFTDATKSWDWCLYEAGLFDRLEDDRDRKIICLHSSSTVPPDPLRHLKTFSSSSDDLHTFLQQVFIEKELLNLAKPIASWLKRVPDKLDKAVSGISQFIDRSPVETEYFTKYLFLQVDDLHEIRPDKIPDNAQVTSTGKSLEIFDKPEGEWLWKDIARNISVQEDSRWVVELAEAIYAVSQGNLPSAIQAMFTALRGKKTYRVLLYRIDKLASGSIIIKILFVEDVTWKLDDVPEIHATLLTSLVMATRFKYELIGKYVGEISAVPDYKIEEVCGGIRQTIMNIESEAESRGLMDQAMLLKAFKAEQRDSVIEMYKDWYVIRAELLEALENKNCVTVRENLGRLADMNKEYLQIASIRYKELIADDY